MGKHELNVGVLDLVDSLGVPHLDEYFGLWSILEEPFRAAVSRIRGLDLRAHVQVQQAEPEPKSAYDAAADYPVTDDGIAVIELTGPLMKYASSMSGGTSTVLARRQLRNAVNNQAVRGILLRIDSPGGTVAGTKDLADDVAKAAAQKPLFAYFEDLGASAAYWIGAQARKVYANATAIVGSIGTYGVIYDTSEMAEQMGVKVHIIRAGKFKGAGEPGTEIGSDQLAEWQRRVDTLNEFFIQGVAAGRKLTQDKVRELADGRVHVGAEAQQLKLIDGVQSLDETLSQLARNSKPRGMRMSDTNNAEANDAQQPAAKPASFEDLKIFCPGADDSFICAQLGRKATEDQARSAWAEEQNRRLEATQKQLDEAKAQAAAAKDAGGVEPVKTGSANSGDDAGDAVADFGQRVAEKMKQGMPRRRAVAAVARADPELHHQYLKQTNPNKTKVQALIDERCELV